MQSWSDENLARTRSARHKLLKFLRDHSALHTPKAALQTPPAPHLETMEILDNSLRQPTDQGRAARAEPLAVKSKSHWLTVQCVDKPGSLAEIARAIAQHEQNIKVSLIFLIHSKMCSLGVWMFDLSQYISFASMLSLGTLAHHQILEAYLPWWLCLAAAADSA